MSSSAQAGGGASGTAGGSAKKQVKTKAPAGSSKSPGGGGAASAAASSAAAGGKAVRKRKVGAELAERSKYGKPPFVQSWDAFDGEARRLFQRNPNNVREAVRGEMPSDTHLTCLTAAELLVAGCVAAHDDVRALPKTRRACARACRQIDAPLHDTALLRMQTRLFTKYRASDKLMEVKVTTT
jgi:hypothetical protein